MKSLSCNFCDSYGQVSLPVFISLSARDRHLLNELLKSLHLYIYVLKAQGCLSLEELQFCLAILSMCIANSGVGRGRTRLSSHLLASDEAAEWASATRAGFTALLHQRLVLSMSGLAERRAGSLAVAVEVLKYIRWDGRGSVCHYGMW